MYKDYESRKFKRVLNCLKYWRLVNIINIYLVFESVFWLKCKYSNGILGYFLVFIRR